MFDELIHGLAAIEPVPGPDAPCPHTLRLTAEAKDALDAYSAGLEPRLGSDGDLRGIADWGSKLAGGCVRVAGLLSSEGGFFDGLLRYQQSRVANQDWVLKAYSGDPLRVDRKGRPAEMINRPLATLILTAQPYVLERIDSQGGEFRGKGLLARFFFSLPASMVGHRKTTPPVVPDRLVTMFDELIHGLAAIEPVPGPDAPCPHTLRLTAEAKDALDAYSAGLEPRLGSDGDLRGIADWGSKLAGGCVRVAGLLHLARQPDGAIGRPINLDTMRAALAIGDYALGHAQAAFDAVGLDPSMAGARRILAWIERDRREGFQARDCFEAVKGSIPTMAQVNAALTVLEAHFYIRRQAESVIRRGRPRSPTYVVNPSLHSHYSQNRGGARRRSSRPDSDRTTQNEGAASGDASAQDRSEAALLRRLDERFSPPDGGWIATPRPDDRAEQPQNRGGRPDRIGGEAVAPAICPPAGGVEFDPCPYPSHRASDWCGSAEQRVCGICHPRPGPPR